MNVLSSQAFHNQYIYCQMYEIKWMYFLHEINFLFDLPFGVLWH